MSFLRSGFGSPQGSCTHLCCTSWCLDLVSLRLSLRPAQGRPPRRSFGFSPSRSEGGSRGSEGRVGMRGGEDTSAKSTHGAERHSTWDEGGWGHGAGDTFHMLRPQKRFGMSRRTPKPLSHHLPPKSTVLALRITCATSSILHPISRQMFQHLDWQAQRNSWRQLQ